MSIRLKNLLENVWQVYKKNFLKIILAILIVWIPLLLLQHVWIEPTMKIDEASALLQNEEILKSPEHEADVIFAGKVTFLYSLIVILLAFLGMVSDIMIIKIAGESHDVGLSKVSSPLNDIFSASITPLFKCIWSYFLAILFVAFGLMMFVFPGIYIWVMSSLAVTVTVMEGISGVKAIKYSFSKVREDIFTVAAGMLIFLLIDAIIVFGIEHISGYLPSSTAITIATNIVLSIIDKIVLALNVVFLAVFFCEKRAQAKINNEPQPDIVLEAEQ